MVVRPDAEPHHLILTPSTPPGPERALGERRRRYARVIAARLCVAGLLFQA